MQPDTILFDWKRSVFSLFRDRSRLELLSKLLKLYSS